MRLKGSRIALAAAALFGAVAVWQLGAGAYIHAKALLAQQLMHDAWSRTLQGEPHARPWPWADTWPVARLRAPAYGVDQIVLAGASGRNLAFGPGHLDGTPLPGRPGNSIVAGHRDTSFRFLARLKRGDRLTVEGKDGVSVSYRVTETRIADSRKQWLSPPFEGRMLTLVTCYPFVAVVPGGPLRYVVFAEEA